MKKYMLGIIAIAIIAVASAFTIAHKTDPVKHDPVTYWFEMDASGTQVTTTQVADPAALCPSLIGADCARKYDESQTEVIGGIRQVISGQEDHEVGSRGKE